MMLMSSTQSFPFLKGLLEGDIYFRFRREVTETPEVTTEDMGTAPPIETGEAVGPTLGDILSKFSLVVMIVYIIGIGWKLVKIYKGDYEREEPIYLKYK